MTDRRGALTGYLFVAFAACMWGTWPLILRRAEAIHPMPPALESTWLMLTLVIVSGPLMLRDRVHVKATPKDWATIAWLGVADSGNVGLLFGAYQRTSIAVAVLTHYLTPTFVALAAPLLLRERANARTYAAVGVSFVGLVLLLAPWRGIGTKDLAGAAFGAGSAVFYASNVLFTKRLTGTFSGSEVTFFHCLVALPLLAALVPPAAWRDVDPRALGVISIGTLGPGALAGLLFVWGLRRVRASHASTLTLLEPLVAVLIATFAFGESLTLRAAFGGAMILAGAALVVALREDA